MSEIMSDTSYDSDYATVSEQDAFKADVEEARQRASALFDAPGIRLLIFLHSEKPTQLAIIRTTKNVFKHLANHLYRITKLSRLIDLRSACADQDRYMTYTACIEYIIITGQLPALSSFNGLKHIFDTFSSTQHVLWETGTMSRADVSRTDTDYIVERTLDLRRVLPPHMSSLDYTSSEINSYLPALDSGQSYGDIHLDITHESWASPSPNGPYRIEHLFPESSGVFELPINGLEFSDDSIWLAIRGTIGQGIANLSVHLLNRRKKGLPEYKSIFKSDSRRYQLDNEALTDLFHGIIDYNPSLEVLCLECHQIAKDEYQDAEEGSMWTRYPWSSLQNLRELELKIDINCTYTVSCENSVSIRPECAPNGSDRYGFSHYLTGGGLPQQIPQLRGLHINICSAVPSPRLPDPGALGEQLVALGGRGCEYTILDAEISDPRAGVQGFCFALERAIDASLRKLDGPPSSCGWKRLKKS